MTHVERTGTPTEKTRLFLVDDHPVVRDALERAVNREPDLVVCGTADDVEPALAGIRATDPGIVLTDLNLKDSSGFDLIKQLKAERPDLPVLVLSVHDEATHAARAIRAGAKGYVMKVESLQGIIAAARTVLGGDIHLSESAMPTVLAQCMADEQKKEGVEGTLSKRELTVFEMIGQGLTTAEIAEALFISRRTVESHRDHIKAKLKIESMVQLHQEAYRWVHGLSAQETS
jgi:DNA-binding NarL/FixJ family response regulator